MFNLDYKLKMSGMKISNQNQSTIRVIMENLVNKSPSDSFISLYIVSGESQVNGFLCISSAAIRMDFSHTAGDPIGVVKMLSKDLLSQINHWKLNRII